ncbi:hypothetical protein B0H14DRAFT_1164584 [Mycena olivaceomarginata]|nr:hypothetical protein B0H14DRAFT_1164584 [Mycena olivaceomarginata]
MRHAHWHPHLLHILPPPYLPCRTLLLAATSIAHAPAAAAPTLAAYARASHHTHAPTAHRARPLAPPPHPRTCRRAHPHAHTRRPHVRSVPAHPPPHASALVPATCPAIRTRTHISAAPVLAPPLNPPPHAPAPAPAHMHVWVTPGPSPPSASARAQEPQPSLARRRRIVQESRVAFPACLCLPPCPRLARVARTHAHRPPAPAAHHHTRWMYASAAARAGAPSSTCAHMRRRARIHPRYLRPQPYPPPVCHFSCACAHIVSQTQASTDLGGGMESFSPSVARTRLKTTRTYL